MTSHLNTGRGGETSVAVRPEAPVTLRSFEQLDALDHTWANAVMHDRSMGPILIMAAGGMVSGVLLASKAVPMEVSLGIFMCIPIFWVVHMLRKRRSFIAKAAEQGIDAAAARKLLARAPKRKGWYEE